MSKRGKNHRLAATDEDDDFCLADALTLRSDGELELMAEEHAQADVSSNALEGISIDKERLRVNAVR